MGVSKDCSIFGGTPYYLSNGKSYTYFKFGQYIQRVHPNKIPLKMLEKRERGRIQGLPNFFGYPLLSQERQKLRYSNFAQSEQKPIKHFGKSSRGHSQGLPKIFRSPIHMAHRAVIFATARLSCFHFVHGVPRVPVSRMLPLNFITYFNYY